MRCITTFVAIFLSLTYCVAQTPESIVKKYVQKIGGDKNWKKVKSMTTSGEYDYGGISFPFKSFAKAPNKYKFVVTSEGRFYAQGFDGKNGWRLDAFKNETKPTLLTGTEAINMANEADVEIVDMLVNYKEKGHKLTYVGKDSLKDGSCFILKVAKKNGDTETLYIDTESYALRMKETLSKNAELHKAPLRIYYYDYREVDGIRIPFKTVCESDQQIILIITIDKASLNVPIDDKEFQP